LSKNHNGLQFFALVKEIHCSPDMDTASQYYLRVNSSAVACGIFTNKQL